MSNLKGEDKLDGAAFDDFFDSIGKKAENLTLKDSALKSNDSGATTDRGELTAESADTTDDGDGQKVVDEIESLCMNCHKNVRRWRILSHLTDTNVVLTRESHVCYLL